MTFDTPRFLVQEDEGVLTIPVRFFVCLPAQGVPYPMFPTFTIFPTAESTAGENFCLNFLSTSAHAFSDTHNDIYIMCAHAYKGTKLR